MAKWENVVQTGTRAGQPTPTADQIGVLYFVSDEDVMERWSGSTWEQVAINAAAAARLDNLVATTNPGVGDDDVDGYAVGSIWLNVTDQIEWRCMDATTGAAVWLMGAHTAIYAHLRRTGTQSVNNTTFTPMSFTELVNGNGIGWDSGNPTQLQAPYTGVYSITGAQATASNATGVRYISARINGGAFIGSLTLQSPSHDSLGRANFAQLVYLTAGQYVTIDVYHSKGSALLYGHATTDQYKLHGKIAFIGPM